MIFRWDPSGAKATRSMIYVFEDCSLDTDRRELRRAGTLVPVEPQVFDVLQFLLANCERVVTKDDLIAAVWKGRIVSESTLTSRITAVRQAIGDNGEQQRLVRTVARKGHRFVGDVRIEKPAPAPLATANAPPDRPRPAQSDTPAVSFCRTRDGINLAVATVGTGSVVVRAAHWATNIDHDWQSPITGPLLQRLARDHRLVRYDGRGAGLSDRNIETISPATMLEDLEAVVASQQLDRFALLGISAGAATSVAYAVRHPERVSKLVLLGGYALGRNKRGSPQNAEEAKAFLTMLRSGWEDEQSIFMHAFCSFFLSGATREEINSFVDFQRVATTGENAVKLRMAVDEIDIVDLLEKVTTPTIVFHCVHDNLVPFDQGRRLAASIPNAKFVSLEGANHALLSSEPAWAKFVTETEAFLGDLD